MEKLILTSNVYFPELSKGQIRKCIFKILVNFLKAIMAYNYCSLTSSGKDK